MSDDSVDRALAMLRAGRRWQQGGCEYRQGEYDCGTDEIWWDGETFMHRASGAHGWGDGAPTDVTENIERWDEAKVRDRLAGAVNGYDWEYAPTGAPSTPSEFDPLLPMPGRASCALPVTVEDANRVIGHLRRGYSFEHAGVETRGQRKVWGKERLWHPPHSERFVYTRYWALGSGDDVRVVADVWGEDQIREFLLARPDVVHAESWPKG